MTRAATIGARYALAVVVGVIALSKFTRSEAMGIQPLIAHSPFVSWAYSLGSVRGVSDVIGTIELVIVALLLARPVAPFATVVGASLAVLTFLTTFSFLFSTPGALVFGGLHVLDATGAFLIKDLALLAVSAVVLGEAMTAAAASACDGSD